MSNDTKAIEIEILKTLREDLIHHELFAPYLCIALKVEICSRLPAMSPEACELIQALRREILEFLDVFDYVYTPDSSGVSLNEVMDLPYGSRVANKYRKAILDTMLARRGVR